MNVGREDDIMSEIEITVVYRLRVTFVLRNRILLELGGSHPNVQEIYFGPHSTMAESSFSVSKPWRIRILGGEVCSALSVKYVLGNQIATMAKMAGIRLPSMRRWAADGAPNHQPVLNFQAVSTGIQNQMLCTETMVIPMIETRGAVVLTDEFFAIQRVSRNGNPRT